MDFSCKKFSLNHSKSTMKVGTDSILLSSIVATYYEKQNIQNIQNVRNVLDVGTGCGIIALCMAQIFPSANIIGIDIDKDSVEEAQNNFLQNTWQDRMQAKHIGLKQFALKNKENFDLIISNPPYFTNSLLSETHKRNLARHNSYLTLSDFVTYTIKLSSFSSKIILILPLQEMFLLEDLFNTEGFFVTEKFDIYSKENSPAPKRVVCIFSQEKQATNLHKIYIHNTLNEYSHTFRTLCNKFLL